jgi:hypothetical protein
MLCPQAGNRETLIHLKDWQRLAQVLQRELSATATVTLARVRAGTIDIGTAMQDTLRDRNQLARNWMTSTIRSREQCQRQDAHRSHDQIKLLRTITWMEAALQEGQQVTRITRVQDLVLENMDIAWSSPLSPQEKLSIPSTDAGTKYLVASLKACRGEQEQQTHKQLSDNRRVLDRPSEKVFED